MRTDLLKYGLVLVLGVCLGVAATAVAGAPGKGVWVLHKSAAETFALAEGKAHAHLMLNEQTGAERASMGYLTGAADFAVPTHKHPGSAELLWFVAGTGDVVIAGASHAVGPGTAIYIPADTEHSFHSTTAFEAVQVYAGPGPEQRFRKVGKAVSAPADK